MEKETTYHCLKCGLISKYRQLKKIEEGKYEGFTRYIHLCPECEGHHFAIYSDVTGDHFIKIMMERKLEKND